ncbi:hypothetical protein [Streptomyces sp. CA-106131]|uniref:hypothetical protein n=1 Tax=Streptomyces sp. CA-106131 TaxID=3240045 RepID=UPI003D8BD20C
MVEEIAAGVGDVGSSGEAERADAQVAEAGQGSGNRRITVGSHVRPLDDLTHRAVLDWLDHRRNRWPNTANPHLLITQKTAVELGPAGKLWTTRATRNLTATLERLRVDRQLEEALTHGADPLPLALVFGIDEKTAIRYADSARALLGEAAEQASQ